MKEITEINADGTALRAAQMKMLDILIEIDRICKKHKLEYWIDFGTLLGAVRHGGFIPWDDDIDISMPSSSYKKFMEVASYELCGEYVLQTEKTEPSSMQGFGLYKVRMKGTLYIMGYDRMDKKYSKGLFVDIFESVSYPSINRKLYSFLVRRICKSFGFMIYNKELNFGNIVRYFVFPVEFAFFFIIWKFVCLFGKKEREYPAITRIIDGYPSLKSDIYPLTTIEFEGHAFSCPKNPHARLKEWCCDYMVVPPVEKRRMHAKFICIDTSNCFVGKE